MKDSEDHHWCDQCKFQIFCVPRRAHGKHFCSGVCEDIWLSEHEVTPIGSSSGEVA